MVPLSLLDVIDGVTASVALASPPRATLGKRGGTFLPAGSEKMCGANVALWPALSTYLRSSSLYFLLRMFGLLCVFLYFATLQASTKLDVLKHCEMAVEAS